MSARDAAWIIANVWLAAWAVHDANELAWNMSARLFALGCFICGALLCWRRGWLSLIGLACVALGFFCALFIPTRF